jgi:hypothetical protein
MMRRSNMMRKDIYEGVQMLIAVLKCRKMAV